MPFFGLLLVRDAHRTLRNALAQVADQPVVEADIIFGRGNDPLLQQIIEILARNLQRDELRTLLDAIGRSIGPCGLTLDFAAPPAAVEQHLLDAQTGFERIEFVVGDAQRPARRIFEAANAHRSFDRNARQEKALRLFALELDCRLVFNRLIDLGMRLHCGFNRRLQLDPFGPEAAGYGSDCGRNE